MRFNNLVALVLAAAATVAASGARAGVDWTAYAYDLQRTGYIPKRR